MFGISAFFKLIGICVAAISLSATSYEDVNKSDLESLHTKPIYNSASNHKKQSAYYKPVYYTSDKKSPNQVDYIFVQKISTLPKYSK